MLVPSQWHDSYVRMGCEMNAAPAGAPTVTEPTPYVPPAPPPAPKVVEPSPDDKAKPRARKRAGVRRKGK